MPISGGGRIGALQAIEHFGRSFGGFVASFIESAALMRGNSWRTFPSGCIGALQMKEHFGRSFDDRFCCKAGGG